MAMRTTRSSESRYSAPTMADVARLAGVSAMTVSRALRNGASIAPYASDYAYTLTKAGLPVKFAQGAEGTPASFITTNLVANRPNQPLALKFIDMSLS